MNSYEQDNVVRCSATFTENGTALDPGNVTFTCAKPDLTVLTYVYLTDSQLVRDALGVYHVDVLGDVGNHGTPYQFRFYSTGTHAGSTSGSFYIIPRT